MIKIPIYGIIKSSEMACVPDERHTPYVLKEIGKKCRGGIYYKYKIGKYMSLLFSFCFFFFLFFLSFLGVGVGVRQNSLIHRKVKFADKHIHLKHTRFFKFQLSSSVDFTWNNLAISNLCLINGIDNYES